MQSGSPLSVGDLVAEAYVVERILGSGGMAHVALASHREYRHRVAIKILRPENARRTEVVKRFEREQRTLMMLHSEHTLRIYGFGQHAGLPYMLLEYLQGKDLEALVKAEGPLPVERAVEYTLQACHAIAEAHLLGVVHRDLKPGNLFLTRRTDGSPCIKVLDFGISKVSHDQDALEEPSLVTRAHAVMGSPFYMPPEQMLSSTNVDARSDIWSLGVTLYELLTKSLPFAADSAAAVCRRIMSDEPTPLRRLRPSYPAGLEDAIARCLQKRPEKRFANIADFALRLGEFAPGHSRYAIQAISELIPPTEPYSAEEPSAAPTVPLTTAAGAELATTAGGLPSSDATVYLPHGSDSAGGFRLMTVLGASALAFGLGVGVGWALNLNTDPTLQGPIAPGAPVVQPTGSTMASSQLPSVAPARPSSEAASSEGVPLGEAKPTEPPIDLDGTAKARATSASTAPTGTTTGSSSPSAVAPPTPATAAPKAAAPQASAAPAPPPPPDSQPPPPPPPPQKKAPSTTDITF
jgi:serine/threonine protein kinase